MTSAPPPTDLASYTQAILELTHKLSSSDALRETLSELVRRIAITVGVNRVSIVVAPQSRTEGFVVASSMDTAITNLPLDLNKYPEILHVLKHNEVIAIGDPLSHPLFIKNREALKGSGVDAIWALPIAWKEHPFGALVLRSVGQKRVLDEHALVFCRIVANAIAVTLRSARVMQSLVDRTRRLTYARIETEMRLKSLTVYANLFASASDGMIAADIDGNLLFANPRAHEILGLATDDLLSRDLRSMVHYADLEKAERIWNGFAAGNFPQSNDIRLYLPSGATIVVSASFSPLQDSDGAVLISFRDVTKERETAQELVKTKEFLESLIDASMDAIIATDMAGTIMLFNKGAEHMTKHVAPNVIAKMSVGSLFPEGTFEQIRSRLQSREFGGVGRLDRMQLEIVDFAGAVIPISLSGGIIYEEGEPAAMFGIYRDLRERVRIEERLAEAQAQLKITEKQALLAELAGTAAHELNQPLTSIMGYAQWLQQHSELTEKQRHAADTIMSQVERVADIVKKIGKITKYETKSYVGSQRILDLEKSVVGSKSDSG
ncbi:MAG: PAS domain S-box protein [Myxococcales bacterium]|nr:PAS domain S-box protein [Myxococcales bacterium]MCB9707172.1 PAS domain S-box protein [Myxococcales bacterium]